VANPSKRLKPGAAAALLSRSPSAESGGMEGQADEAGEEADEERAVAGRQRGEVTAWVLCVARLVGVQLGTAAHTKLLCQPPLPLCCCVVFVTL
jgi:hypothetical protein